MGNKNSGRRKLKDELMMHRVVDLAWQTLRDGLINKDVPYEMKIDIAKAIAPKSIPKDINVNHKDPYKIVIEMGQPQEQIEKPKPQIEDKSSNGSTVIEVLSDEAAS